MSRTRLRSELEFPVLDDALVVSLVSIAAALDDAVFAGRDDVALRARFDELAGSARAPWS